MMILFELTLVLTTLLCALVAGFVFAFATVVMPGIANLNDREYIRAFQVIDGIIQAGQPVFGLVFVGSILTLVLSAIMGVILLDGMQQALIVMSTIGYVIGVLLPTFRINVPMNNALQALNTESMDAIALASARSAFEKRWLHWNSIRTVIASTVSAGLMFVLLRL